MSFNHALYLYYLIRLYPIGPAPHAAFTNYQSPVLLVNVDPFSKPPAVVFGCVDPSPSALQVTNTLARTAAELEDFFHSRDGHEELGYE